MPARRAFLCAVIPAALAAAPARAFVARQANAAQAADFALGAACGVSHAAIRAEIERSIGVVTPEVQAQLDRLAVCPFCGCVVVGALDHGERARPPAGSGG